MTGRTSMTMDALEQDMAKAVLAKNAVPGREYTFPGKRVGERGDKVVIEGRQGSGKRERVLGRMKGQLVALYMGQSLEPVDPTPEELAAVPVELAALKAMRRV